MKPLLILLAGLNLLAAASSLAADALPPARSWAFEHREGGLALQLDGQQVGEFVYRDTKVLRPFFANLRAPGGVAVTRHHPPMAGTDATDHDTMHPGVWLGFGDLNGHDFWRNRGHIEHVRFTEPPQVEKERLRFATECRLLATDGATLGSLSNRFTLIAFTNAWLLVWEADFQAGDAGLIFGDQEEMGFGARVATAITEKNGGVITSSSGLNTAKRTWGLPAEWCDYSGTVDGQRVGIVLMADPANFRPAWWHNRDYGLMVANPFGQEAMKQGAKSRVRVQRGESFRLCFGAAVHQGRIEDVAALYQAFLLGNRVPRQRH
ncbi:MAG: PmoA family protein [Verrucomicrobia bacterium]|nr:PmoA family protein [Verrucomicrobiota bacterium]